MENISLIDSCGNSNHLSNSISNTSTEENKTNLIVNYLPQTMTNEELKTLFESIGPIEACKLIKNKLNNQSLCYGFVNYANVEDAEKAIKSYNGLKIENKIIKVSYARPSSETIKGANLYVCGIPRDWNVNDLTTYFSQCGRIVTSRILVNSSGQSKGVGFVRFDQRNEAESAINKLNGKIPNGSNEQMIVKFASCPIDLNSKLFSYLPLTVAAAAASGYLSTTKLNASNNNFQTIAALATLKASSNGQLLPNMPQNTQYSFYRNEILCNENQAFQNFLNNHGNQQLQSRSSSCISTTPIITNHSVTPTTTGWCIFVYNLGPETEDNVLWQLFGPFGAVQNVKVIRNYTNQKCKGFGFVTMSSYEDACNAINSLNGFNFGNRILQVSFKTN